MDEKILARLNAMAFHMQAQIDAITNVFLSNTAPDQRNQMQSDFLDSYDRSLVNVLGPLADTVPHLIAEYRKSLDTLRETSLPFGKPETED